MSFFNIENLAQILVDSNNFTELETVYRYLTYMIQCTGEQKDNMHISQNERHLLYRSLIEVKQSMMKSLYKSDIKFENFMDLRGKNIYKTYDQIGTQKSIESMSLRND